MQKLLIITICMSLLMCVNLKSYADDDNSIPITLKEKPDPDPTKVKSPLLFNLSAYTTGDFIVVSSQADMMAQIRIFETESGQSLYDQTVCLAPQWSCPIYVTGTMLTLQVIIDGTIYEGTFFN